MTPHIVITGAPASGKSVFFERLKADPAFAGFTFFDELARRLLSEDPSYRGRWGEFHREIYRRQTERENALAGDRPFITDRGTVDAFAFHPETMRDVDTDLESEYARYTGVVQLGSSAALGERYYPTDDVRNESTGEALHIETAIASIWGAHAGYRFVEADPSLETKWIIFLAIVTDLAGIRNNRKL